MKKVITNALSHWEFRVPHYQILEKLSPAKLEVPQGRAKGVVLSFDVETWSDRCGGKHEETANWKEEYGSFIPNLLEVLDSYGVKAQFFVCGRVIELYPDLLLPLVKGGHGLGGHGYIHEIMSRISKGLQTMIIEKVKSIFMKFLDTQPISWRCPGLAANIETYRALMKNGFKISSNAKGIGGTIDVEGVLEIPIAAKMDGEILGYHSPRCSGAEHWADYMKSIFNKTNRGILVFGMHTWVQRKYDPNLNAVQEFLSYVQNFERETWLGKLDDLL